MTLEAIPPKNTDKHMWIGFNLSQDLPIGIVPAAIGGVFFVALLRRR